MLEQEEITAQPNYAIIELASELVVKERKAASMPSIEERLQALEQENAARKRTEEALMQEIAVRKQTEEMLTIAVRALVSKETFEKLQDTVETFQEQNGKLFNVLINQGALHNERMTDLQSQLITQNNKVTELDNKVTEIDGKVVGLQTEMRQRFTGIETALTQILKRLPENP